MQLEYQVILPLVVFVVFFLWWLAKGNVVRCCETDKGLDYLVVVAKRFKLNNNNKL